MLQAVLLYQCLQSLDVTSIDKLQDFVKELKNSIDAEPARKGVKAQKVSLQLEMFTSFCFLWIYPKLNFIKC